MAMELIEGESCKTSHITSHRRWSQCGYDASPPRELSDMDTAPSGGSFLKLMEGIAALHNFWYKGLCHVS